MPSNSISCWQIQIESLISQQVTLVLSIILTVDNFSISSSEAPNEAKPISWENCAKLGSANNGMWPNNSWIQSLQKMKMRKKEKEKLINKIVIKLWKEKICSKVLKSTSIQQQH